MINTFLSGGHLTVSKVLPGMTTLAFGLDELTSPPGSVGFGTTSHILATYDAATDATTLSVDGTPVASGTQGPFTATGASFAVGRRNSTTPDTFVGVIDEVAVYDRALPAAEGELHHQAGTKTPTTTGYGYDPAGNRTQSGIKTFVYDARNRLTTGGGANYTWDPRGTLAAITKPTAATTVDFDALGRQTGWGTTAYIYDDLDRVTTGGATEFTYAGVEIDPVAVGGERYARSPAGELLALEANGAARLVGENRHGDLAWLLDPTGQVTDSRTWDPYGQPLGATGTTNPSVGYQGDYTDPDTGNVWMGARWYQPTTGGFTSRDTVFGMLKTPVSLNRYTYGNGDPLEHFDPDGRFSINLAGIMGSVASGARHTSASRAAWMTTHRSASQQATASKAATQQRTKPNSEQQRKQLQQMKDYLKGHGALPAGWGKASDDTRTSYYMWSVLRNGGKTRRTWDQFNALNPEDKNAAWNKNSGNALKRIADRDCEGARVAIVCRNKQMINSVATAGLAIGVGMMTGGLATTALAGVGVTTGAGVTAATVGGLSSSAAGQYVATGKIDGKTMIRDGLISAATARIGTTISAARARSAATAARSSAPNTASLAARADELHGALDPIAQTHRTTAVMGTRQGTDVLAGGVRDLSPAQRALARPGDVLGRLPGEHAEITALKAASEGGLTPQGMATTTNICPACRSALEEAGATITGPRSAWWWSW